MLKRAGKLVQLKQQRYAVQQNKFETNLKSQNYNGTKITPRYLNLHSLSSISLSFGVALTVRLPQKYLQIEQNMYQLFYN